MQTSNRHICKKEFHSSATLCVKNCHFLAFLNCYVRFLTLLVPVWEQLSSASSPFSTCFSLDLHTSPAEHPCSGRERPPLLRHSCMEALRNLSSHQDRGFLI